MYQPKFCAECGEKIVRLRWRVWTNRKFCDSCAPRFFREHLIRVATAGIVVLLVGIVIGHATRRVPPPLVVQRTQEPRSSSSTLNGVNSPAAPTEEIYTCGARTKKGTPCSRRVHGPVRCWQHKGMPAMMAQEKLRIKE